ncbi:MAG: hypothetical protein J6B95_03800 [Oscillospiraceae bacterium]|nr:hypothetical protein [Oscillospiraceae bacterium]
MWRFKNFSTGFVEENFTVEIPQDFSPHSTGSVEKFWRAKDVAVTFLSPNKKVTKEIGLKGAELIAPAIKAAPLRIPRRAPMQFGAT